MLEVTMTPDEAEGWCEAWCDADDGRLLPCPLHRKPSWDCCGPECIMCCEAHKQGRADEGSGG